jgi:CRISPR-associated endonuclease/helicase Cas3
LPDDEENYKLHTDRWNAPIILTTQVQLLESIFSAKGSDLRKLHNMAKSVIIFDEAQSIPVKCIHLFNGAMNFINRVCKSTILLCTATQPPFDDVDKKICFSKNPLLTEYIKAPERYVIENSLTPIGYTYPDLAKFVKEKHNNSTLVIVNTKDAAKLLCDELKDQQIPILHLSTNMCSIHRDAVILRLRRYLKSNKPVICISTQLIEAGVDISFECVIRDIAGLDSIYQAAGRCNRHGEYGDVKKVYVVNILGEKLSKLPDIKIGAEITQRLACENNGNINSASINTYYRYYFYERRRLMDYDVQDGSTTIYDLLSENIKGKNAYQNRKDKMGIAPLATRQAIRSAADEFFVIDKGRTEVIITCDRSEKLLQKFISTSKLDEKRKILRKLQKYSISLYQFQLDKLERNGAINKAYNGLTVLARGFYNDTFGVNVDWNHDI